MIAGLSKVGLALRTQAWEAGGERGLTPTQGQILAVLRARGSLKLAEIAEQLAVTPATTSEAVSTLSAKALLTKGRSAADARSLAVTLTAKGRREADRAAGWSDVLLGAVDGLEPSEQEAFLRALIKMIRALQVKGRIPVARMCATCRFFRPNVHADAERPHHCAYVDAPFGDRSLRVDCPEHEAASTAAARSAWRSLNLGWAHPDGE